MKRQIEWHYLGGAVVSAGVALLAALQVLRLNPSEERADYAAGALVAGTMAGGFLKSALDPSDPKPIPFSRFPFTVLTAGLAVLLFCTSDDRPPFPYDHAIRWVTSGVSIYAAVMWFRWLPSDVRRAIIPLPYAALAILFNPIVPFGFSWGSIHIFAVFVFLMGACMVKNLD